MTTIGDRVRTALQGTPLQQKQLAQRVGMTPDALSRALSGHRGFSAIEIAEIASELDVDVHELITGEPDPRRMVLAARHTFDHETGERRVDGAEDDQAALADVRLAYAQAGDAPDATALPTDVGAVRSLLHPDFVRSFIDNLAAIEVDVVRFDAVSTAYSFVVEARPVIVLPETGNWFWENWALAHELGHLALGHDGVMPGQHGFESKEGQRMPSRRMKKEGEGERKGKGGPAGCCSRRPAFATSPGPL